MEDETREIPVAVVLSSVLKEENKTIIKKNTIYKNEENRRSVQFSSVQIRFAAEDSLVLDLWQCVCLSGRQVAMDTCDSCNLYKLYIYTYEEKKK